MMAKIRITVTVPDNGCEKCPYHGHSCFEIGYQCYKEEDYCRLFDNVNLKKKDGIVQRCTACQCCEVE